MKDLQINDEVLVSMEDEIFEPVYTFGHRSSVASAEYHQLQPSNLELSANHMVFVEGKGAIPASMVMVGDKLVGDKLVGDCVVGDKLVGDKLVGDSVVGD